MYVCIQVVSTHYEVGRGLGGSKDTVLQYQMVVNRYVCMRTCQKPFRTIVSHTCLFMRLTSLLFPYNTHSQVMQYNDDEVPEAKFNYDISPMSVVISSKRRAW